MSTEYVSSSGRGALSKRAFSTDVLLRGHLNSRLWASVSGYGTRAFTSVLSQGRTQEARKLCVLQALGDFHRLCCVGFFWLLCGPSARKGLMDFSRNGHLVQKKKKKKRRPLKGATSQSGKPVAYYSKANPFKKGFGFLSFTGDPFRGLV